jgi:hypothetical protein
MRLSIKIPLTILVIFILVVAGLHLYVHLKGKAFLVKKLQDVFKREVTVRSLKVHSPFNIIVKKIEAKDLFKIEKTFIVGGAIDIFRKDFILFKLRLDGLEVNLKTPRKAVTATPAESTPPTPAVTAASAPSIRFPFSQLYIKQLIINKGIFNFTDTNASENGLKITVKDLNIDVENINFPIRSSNIINFSIKGRMPWQEGSQEGKIEAEGWLNLFKKDMLATLKIEDIDGIYLYPYYSKWVDLEKARIEKAKLQFSADLRSLNNDLSGECNLELTDVVFTPRPPEQEQEKAERIAVAVLGKLREMDNGRYVLTFPIKTRMDRPEFNFALIRTAFEQKITQGNKQGVISSSAQQVLNLPVTLLQGMFKGATDITTSVMVGTINAGKEVAGAVFKPFKKASPGQTNPKQNSKTAEQAATAEKTEKKEETK